MDESITAKNSFVTPESPVSDPETVPAAERRVTRDQVVEAIHRMAARHTALDLVGERVQTSHRRVYADAIEVFGSWDCALASALRAALEPERRTVARPPTPSPTSGDLMATPAPSNRRPSVLRQPHPNALRPTLAVTTDGHLLSVAGALLTSSETPQMPGAISPWPAGVGHPLRLIDLAETPHGIGLSADGRLIEIDLTQVIAAGPTAPPERIGASHDVNRWVTVFDRAELETGHVLILATRQGKVRTLATSDVMASLGKASEIQAFELGEGDEPVDAWVAARGDALLLAASSGHVISFDPTALRPKHATPVLPRPSGVLPQPAAGRPSRPSDRARGVRGMQLKDDAHVIGGLLATQGLEVAFVTELGRARRVPVDTFKAQARGGLGSCCTRFEDDSDRLVAAVGCHSSTDIVLFTSRGRDLRLPAPSVPLTERLAEPGAALVDLGADERVVGASRLLPLAYASDTPNAFEI